MQTPPFETRLFSDIEHKLPADTWARWRNITNDGEFDAETVLYHQGDLALDALDLDALATQEPHVFLLLVEGSLRVAGPICNDDTDGAPGLIVLGDLHARSGVVGGQEIYVTGDLRVDDLFWGDYNHGTLKVMGNARIPLLVSTDYSVEITGAQDIGRTLFTLDAAQDEGSQAGLVEPQALFPADCVFDTDDGTPELARTAVLERLRAGRPVVHAHLLLQVRQPPPAIAPLCPDRAPSAANLEMLTQPHLLLQPQPPARTPRLEFWQGDLFCRAAAGEEEDDGSVFRSMYFQDTAHAVMLRFNQVRIPRGFLRKPQVQWLPALRWRRMEGDQTDWQDCKALPAHCAPLFDQGWNALLDGAATLAHARTLIAPERLVALLALPIAAPYDDFYDDDRNGLWLGAVYCAFRQDGAQRKGQPQPALLRVARSRRDGEGNERYDFSLRRHLDGSASVLIEYCPQEGKDWIDVSHTAPGRLPDALRMFEAANRALQQGNAALLDGSPPNRDDHFALQHWRTRGYLR